MSCKKYSTVVLHIIYYQKELPEEMTEERVPWERFVEKEGFKLGKKE